MDFVSTATAAPDATVGYTFNDNGPLLIHTADEIALVRFEDHTHLDSRTEPPNPRGCTIQESVCSQHWLVLQVRCRRISMISRSLGCGRAPLNAEFSGEHLISPRKRIAARFLVGLARVRCIEATHIPPPPIHPQRTNLRSFPRTFQD